MRRALLCAMDRINRFAETRLGRDMAVVALILAMTSIGYQMWRDWPGPKPADLLEANAEAEWRGSYVMITLRYRINKIRSDCSYTSDRLIERIDEKGLPRRFLIEGARGPSVEVGDTGWQETNFFIHGDLLIPGENYKLIVRGMYQCPNANHPADPLAAPFTVPEKTQARALRPPTLSRPPSPLR